MSGGPLYPMVVDERLESYSTFFDHSWAKAIDKLAIGTKLEVSVFNLAVNWKAAANTCVVPWLICTSVSGFVSTFLAGRSPFGDQMIDACAKRLPDEMPKLSNMRRKEMREAIRKIGAEIKEAQDVVLHPNGVWTLLLNGAASTEFRLSIWGSQRISYGGIYHTYENFIREAIGLALGMSHYKAGNISVILKDCERAFGKPIADLCLAASDIEAARRVRNALAHNGGKETSSLHGITHGIRIENGELHIMAQDTKRLFNLLKDRAYKLTETAITHPAIR